MLFNLYINDLSIILTNSGIGGTLGGKFVNHMIYTDDLCIVSLSLSGLQTLLNKCTDYCHLHYIKFNAKKSVCLFFRSSVNKRCALPKKNIFDTICEFSSQVKSLGVMISSSKKNTIDVKRKTRAFYAHVTLLICNFRHCTDKGKCYLF